MRALPIDSVYLSILMIFGTLVDVVVGQETCNKMTSCICQFSDGTKIDLTPIANNDGTPRFNYKKDPNADFEYAYNPCFPFSDLSDASCKDVAACQRSGSKTDHYNIGTQVSATFDSSGTVLTYFGSESRKTNVRLTCNQGVSASNSQYAVVGETAPGSGIYEMTVTSCQACRGGCTGNTSGGLSPGSILCILFVVFAFVYLLGGILFNRYARGASGKEVIPNVSLWEEFPLLVKDGFVFVASGCGFRDEGAGYESI